MDYFAKCSLADINNSSKQPYCVLVDSQTALSGQKSMENISIRWIYTGCTKHLEHMLFP
jgi:hypothetical protein